MKYYASPTGNDSNSGRSPGRPFATVTRAVSALAPGDTLFLRGGTYVERVTIENLDASAAPVVIQSFPGEHATIDGTVDDFRATPNRDWVAGKHPDEFVSVRRYPPETDHGAFLDRSPYTRLITYWTYHDLVARNQRFGPLPKTQRIPQAPWPRTPTTPRCRKRPWVYMGPGIFQDSSGHIHVRLTHTNHAVPGVVNYAGERDPRELGLAIWTAPVATLLVSHCKSIHIRDITVRFGGGRTLKIDRSSGIHVDHVRVLAGPYGVLVGEACRDTSITDCEVDGGLPPWFFRSDRKDGYTYKVKGLPFRNELGKRTLNALLSGAPDAVRTKITRCEFVNGHDLYLFGQHLEFSRNWIDNLNDEALVVDGAAVSDLHVFENVVERCLSALSYAGNAVGGSVFVYRNLFDLRRPTVGIRPRLDPGADDPSRVMRHGQFFKSTPPDGPLDLFHNTILVARQSIQSSYALFRNYIGEHRRRSLNNIFVAFNTTAESDLPIGHVPLPFFPAVTDGNCYHRFGNSTAALLTHKQYDIGEDHHVPREEFATLAAMRDSDIFIDSQAHYPPGFEAHSTDQDRAFAASGRVAPPLWVRTSGSRRTAPPVGGASSCRPRCGRWTETRPSPGRTSAASGSDHRRCQSAWAVGEASRATCSSRPTRRRIEDVERLGVSAISRGRGVAYGHRMTDLASHHAVEDLRAINAQFIDNFVANDVAAHDALLHPSFLYVRSDGSRVDRVNYLEAGQPASTPRSSCTGTSATS